jgi:hypothetical protein
MLPLSPSCLPPYLPLPLFSPGIRPQGQFGRALHSRPSSPQGQLAPHSHPSSSLHARYLDTYGKIFLNRLRQWGTAVHQGAYKVQPPNYSRLGGVNGANSNQWVSPEIISIWLIFICTVIYIKLSCSGRTLEYATLHYRRRVIYWPG